MAPDPSAVAMAAFRTYSGEPLPKLLSAHGVRILSATPTMLSSLPKYAWHPGDQGGDIAWDVELHASAPRLPCGLNQQFGTINAQKMPISGHGDAIFEVTQRGAVLPSSASDLENPLVYWLAKGKCLE